nr:endonuclease/exonuclease/phosphatase family protein [uncultured Rhodoferax sp.]
MKLITWNTQWGCGLDGRVNLKRIVSEARAMADFDVLCLQEIACGFEAMPGHPGDQPAQLQALLPGYTVFFGAAVDEFDAQGQRQRFGNLIATRLPVASVQHHPLPWPADAGVRSMPRMCTEVTVTDPRLGAVRIMTTHLEFYSARQRMAQAQALRALHMQACEQAAAQPLADHSHSPFQSKTHTRHAILCGDFNFEPGAPEYATIQQPFRPLVPAIPAQEAINIVADHLQDAWPLVLGQTPHAPTFRLFDRTYGPEPITCDYVFVSQSLVPRVQSLSVNLNSRASDHQPLWIELV